MWLRVGKMARASCSPLSRRLGCVPACATPPFRLYCVAFIKKLNLQITEERSPKTEVHCTHYKLCWGMKL